MITIISTVHEYMLYWNSPECSPLFSDRMREDQERYITRYIAPCIGNVHLNEFDSSHVRMLSMHLSESGLSEAMQFIVLRVFRQAMMHAHRHYRINKSFCDSLYLPVIMDIKVRIYTPEQVVAIFDALKCELMCNYYKLIFYTDIQSMEARALRVSDIDLPNDVMHIRQRIYGKTLNASYVKKIENPQQKRDIYLTPQVKAIIEDELIRRHRKEKSSIWNDTGQDLLFVYYNGNPVTDTYNRQTRILVEAITGIPDFCTLALRYTAADAALKAGASEKVIQDMLGFTSLRYIERVKDKFI